MDERGDPEPGLVNETALLGDEPRGAGRGFDRAGAVHAGVMPDAVAGDVGQDPVVAGRELIGHRGDDAAVLIEPVADELRGLLLEGHRGHKAQNAIGCRHDTHPFTAPVRPPTMRFSNRLKKISAGIIDSEVYASTRAVSTEY